MSGLEETLNQVLSNPQLMQHITSLAQSMSENRSEPKQTSPPLPTLDPGLLQTVAGMATTATVDRDQQALLRALGPYVSRERVGKLEKAMRAAKMAAFASSLLQTQSRR